VNYTGSAPARQPVPDAAERDFPEAPTPPEVLKPAENTVVYLRLFWEHRQLVSRVTLYALLASTLIAFLIPARYESTARLMPPDSSQSGGLAMAAAALSGSSGGLGGIAGEMLGMKSTSDIFMGILSSRTVQDKLIQQFDLRKLYGDRRMEDARKDLAEHTGISVDRKSQIIALNVTDHDPKRAAAMGEAYVAELNRLVSELSTSSARRERIFLEERLKSVSQDLEAAATLQGQLIAGQSELEGLKQIYTDSNVRVRSVSARIAELKRQLEKLGGKGEQAAEASGQQADYLYPSIRKLPLLGVTYADLYRRTRVQEAVFETLTKEYEMAKVQEAKEIPTVKVLDAPNIPEKKSFPPRLLTIFLGTCLGLMFSMTWVFGKTRWEGTEPDDPRKVFALEVLTTVKGRIPGFSRNGAGSHSDGGSARSGMRRRGDAEADSE